MSLAHTLACACVCVHACMGVCMCECVYRALCIHELRLKSGCLCLLSFPVSSESYFAMAQHRDQSSAFFHSPLAPLGRGLVWEVPGALSSLLMLLAREAWLGCELQAESYGDPSPA